MSKCCLTPPRIRLKDPEWVKIVSIMQEYRPICIFCFSHIASTGLLMTWLEPFQLTKRLIQHFHLRFFFSLNKSYKNIEKNILYCYCLTETINADLRHLSALSVFIMVGKKFCCTYHLCTCHMLVCLFRVHWFSESRQYHFNLITGNFTYLLSYSV